MTWFVVVDATGEARSFATVLPGTLPDGLEAIELGPERPDFEVEQWSAETRTLVARVLGEEELEAKLAEVDALAVRWQRHLDVAEQADRAAVRAKLEELEQERKALLGQWAGRRKAGASQGGQG